MEIRDFTNNNPTYEMLDQHGRPLSKSILMDILVNNQPYYMYPFLHLLKDGTLFVFTSKSSQIFDVNSNKIVRNMPDLPGRQRTYPNTGGSVMFPLTKQNNYEAEIMVCGGGEIDLLTSLTDDSCGIIKPVSINPKWKITKMPGGGRVMVEGILLLDGTILWLNGAAEGCQGFGTASKPQLDALIYNPTSDKWSTAGHSNIPRLYHSVALMLLDGTILVAGSNPNEMPLLEKDVDTGDPTRAFPTEFRVEIYTPSYLIGKTRPTEIKLSQIHFAPGDTIATVGFKAQSGAKTLKVLLYHGGFITHSLHMGQVMVEMEHLGMRHMHKDRHEAFIRVPKIKLAPGPYVIYVVVDGVPGLGQFVSVGVSR